MTTTPEAAAEIARLHAELDAANRACVMADTEAAKHEAYLHYFACHKAYHVAKGDFRVPR